MGWALIEYFPKWGVGKCTGVGKWTSEYGNLYNRPIYRSVRKINVCLPKKHHNSCAWVDKVHPHLCLAIRRRVSTLCLDIEQYIWHPVMIQFLISPDLSGQHVNVKESIWIP